jgi:hypothetical protein
LLQPRPRACHAIAGAIHCYYTLSLGRMVRTAHSCRVIDCLYSQLLAYHCLLRMALKRLTRHTLDAKGCGIVLAECSTQQCFCRVWLQCDTPRIP